MKQKYSLVIFSMLCLFIFDGSILYSQSANPLIHAMQFSQPVTNKVASLPTDAIEDVSKRTLYSSTWKTGTGKFIARYSSTMINYPDANGQLQPVDLTLHSDSRGWVADKQLNACYLHSDRSTAINIGGNDEITFNKNCTINGMPLDQQIVSMKNEKVVINMSQGVHKYLMFVDDGIKTDYVFDTALEGGINVAEEVEVPAGCTLQRDEQYGTYQPSGWEGDYLLLAPDGKQILARFLAAECYDSKRHWCFANYSVEKKDGKNILTTSIPAAWLATAVYPVTLDPLVVGRTSHWTGGSTPSCQYPNFSTDSILVTIPPKITVTYFTVDYAYVSSTAGRGIPLNDGLFYLSTPCRNNPNDTTRCRPGDTAGICYLLPYEDFHDPYTCCYSPKCDSQSFYLDAHLSRFSGGVGCDTSTIWYSKGRYAGFQYFFSAYIEGYTDSVISLKYNPASQCSNSCNLTMDALIRYGVPPYRVSHPWAARDTVVGAYASCTSQGTAILNLKIPGAHCPFTCLSPDTTILVPPPIVVDFCNDTVRNIPSLKVTLKPIPIISATPIDSVVCSGFPVTLGMNSCVPGTTYNWISSFNVSGSGDSVIDHTIDTGSGPMTVTYKIAGSANGCNSDTITAKGVINPVPIMRVSPGNDSIKLGSSVTLKASGAITYSWSPATGLSCTNCPNPVATPTITTTYTVTGTDSGGCEAEVVFTIFVQDQTIIIPNVITPNNAGSLGLDNVFFITNLNYYPNSKLTIYDRWGKQIYTNSNYLNDWNGGGQSDGVYYYTLILQNGKKYQGFYQLIK
ncbi:MAG TPA: gliding motility-associated C-terminal domain-containing protein [Bacteroidia bacterium]|jgi:gliding motility-associated-like protein|nr:gliding motility-associated C-terminal domain-containing protein [Bacteroidia bacterium]